MNTPKFLLTICLCCAFLTTHHLYSNSWDVVAIHANATIIYHSKDTVIIHQYQNRKNKLISLAIKTGKVNWTRDCDGVDSSAINDNAKKLLLVENSHLVIRDLNTGEIIKKKSIKFKKKKSLPYYHYGKKKYSTYTRKIFYLKEFIILSRESTERKNLFNNFQDCLIFNRSDLSFHSNLPGAILTTTLNHILIHDQNWNRIQYVKKDTKKFDNSQFKFVHFSNPNQPKSKLTNFKIFGKQTEHYRSMYSYSHLTEHLNNSHHQMINSLGGDHLIFPYHSKIKNNLIHSIQLEGEALFVKQDIFFTHKGKIISHKLLINKSKDGQETECQSFKIFNKKGKFIKQINFYFNQKEKDSKNKSRVEILGIDQKNNVIALKSRSLELLNLNSNKKVPLYQFTKKEGVLDFFSFNSNFSVNKNKLILISNSSLMGNNIKELPTNHFFHIFCFDTKTKKLLWKNKTTIKIKIFNIIPPHMQHQ